MKKTIFECDICKEQMKNIFEAGIVVRKLSLGKGERDNVSPPMEINFQICSFDCLQKMVINKKNFLFNHKEG